MNYLLIGFKDVVIQNLIFACPRNLLLFLKTKTISRFGNI